MAFTLLHNKKENKKRKKKESVPMNKISRKGFIKIAAAAAMSGGDRRCFGCLQCRLRLCFRFHFGAAGQLHPRHLRGHCRGYLLHCQGHHDLLRQRCHRCVMVDTSAETASYGAAAADELREQLMAAGSAEIDGVSGSTVTSNAVMKAAKSCYAQAKGEAVVSSVQLAHRR